MFGSVLTAIGLLLHIYVFWRTATVPFVRRRVRPRIIAGVGLLMAASFAAGRTLGHGAAGVAFSVLELLSMTWLATLFLVAVCLAATELVTCGGWLFARYAPVLRGWALVAGAGLSGFAAFQGLRPPVVQQYDVQLAGLPPELDGAVLVALSDLHLDVLSGPGGLDDLVARVSALRPDLVVLLGDIFEGHGPPQDELSRSLSQLTAPLGVWAVLGNHDRHRGGGSMPAAEGGAQTLLNRSVELRPGLVLVGVEDLTVARRRGRDGGLVEQALAARPPGATILLSHTPWQTEAAARRGVGLMLCGHTHGGQIWPLNYLIRTRYPLVSGRYEVDRMTVLVCRGTGTWGPRMRLWRPGEIMLVTLRAKAAS